MASTRVAPRRSLALRWARRRTPRVLVGALASGVMACSISGQLTAIDEPLLDVAGASSPTPEVTVSQTTGATVCSTTSATCSDADLFGGVDSLAPGASRSVTMRFTNTGQQNIATRTLVAGNCVTAAIPGAVGSTTPTPDRTLCDTVRVAIFEGTPVAGRRLYAGRAAAIPTRLTLAPLAAGATQTYTFRVTLPPTATDTTQGQTITQSLTWNNSL